MVVRDDIVRECLYMCNQNFDRRKLYHCVAQSNENWMVWNFPQKKIPEEKDITSHVPKFVNVHHVVVKTFQGSQFLRCDCYVYERWVHCSTWIHLLDEFIYTWIHLSRAIINKWIHLLMLSQVRWIHVYKESRSTYLLTY